MGTQVVGDNWYRGNAAEDGKDTRGWLLGHFMPPEDVRHSTGVEVKWGIHEPGEKRTEWASDAERTTMLLLVQGRFRLDLAESSTTLESQGDYVVWGPGHEHKWEALTDAVVITVRWPTS